jgi:hypothetical protein
VSGDARVRSVEVARLHIILCFAFDHHAAAADVDSYKGALIGCPDVCHAVETSGPFDFFVEFDLPDLQAYNDCLKLLVEPLPSFVIRYEACFIVRSFGWSVGGADSDLWLPSRDGLRRIQHNRVDVVQAEGDDVRIHSGNRAGCFTQRWPQWASDWTRGNSFVFIARRSCESRSSRECWTTKVDGMPN